MKVLQIVTFVDEKRTYGGPVSVAFQLAEEFGKQGHDVDIVALSKSSSRSFQPFGIYLFQARVLFGKDKFKFMFSLRAFLWVWQNAPAYDIVHLHFSRDLFQVLCGWILILRKSKFVVQTHGMLAESNKDLLRFRRTYDFLVGRVLIQSKAQLALNKFEAAQLSKMGWFRSGLVVGNGVAFKKLKIHQGPKVRRVLFLSRLHKRKNPDLFVALAQNWIEDKDDQTEFIIAGPDGGELSSIKKQILEVGSDRLQYIGAVTHEVALDLLDTASLLVLPSRDEPFPMVVLEALSLGIPVVVTESCQISKELESIGVAEIAKENFSSLSEASQKILGKDLSRNFVQNAARKIFDVRVVSQNIIRIYTCVTEGKVLQL